MADGRFEVVVIGTNDYAIVDIPLENLKKLQTKMEVEAHTLVRIKSGGFISQRLANTWIDQICDQLNGFDTANAAVAKLKPPV